ncbi:bZIP transcription factor, partial [Aspergillus nomiae NRRL 13137]
LSPLKDAPPPSLRHSVDYYSKHMMASNPDPQPKKRESRAGTRKVTSLSAEQLERKRANDREAQRTIRQRTKEHIERLEHQVAELKSKGEQYDHVVRRNTALENEIRALKQQLALVRSGQAYSSPAGEGSYNTPSGPVLPSQFTEPLSVNPVSRTPSALSTSSQVSVVPDWQQYGSTGSPSICESSDADYTNRVEPFIFEGQLQTSNPMPVAAPQASFNTPTGHPTEPGFHSYSHLYPGGGPNQVRRGEHPHNPQHVQCATSQRSMSVPTIPSERELRGYPVIHAAQQYQQAPEQPPRNDYGYDWTRRQ